MVQLYERLLLGIQTVQAYVYFLLKNQFCYYESWIFMIFLDKIFYKNMSNFVELGSIFDLQPIL